MRLSIRPTLTLVVACVLAGCSSAGAPLQNNATATALSPKAEPTDAVTRVPNPVADAARTTVQALGSDPAADPTSSQPYNADPSAIASVPASPGPMATAAAPSSSASPASPAPTFDPQTFAIPSDSDIAADAVLPVDDQPPQPPDSVDPNPALAAMSAAYSALPAEEWDVDALAATFGGDPDRAFAFVRDSIAFDPYPGVLRGAAGTLAARAGNDADRATLLKALLDAMGFTTQFAFAQLDPATASEVVARSFQAPTAPLTTNADSAIDVAFATAAASRAKRDYALLRQTLDTDIGAMGTATPPDLASEVSQHVWVQVQGDQGWQDLDPTLPDATPGSVLAPAQSSSDSVPDDQNQTITVSLATETMVDGSVEDDVPLDVQLNSADAENAQILLWFQPDQGGGVAGGLSGGQAGYDPVLSVNGNATIGDTIAIDGSDSGLTGDSDVQLMSMTLQLETDGPGLPTETSQHVLLDRVPPALRASGTVTEDQLDPMPTVGGEPVAMANFQNVMVSTGGSDARADIKARASALLFVANQVVANAPDAGWGPGDVLSPLTATDSELVTLSEHAVLAGMNHGSAGRAFIGRPRMFLVSEGPDPAEPTGFKVGVDLALDGVNQLSAPGSAAQDGVKASLWYGVAETSLETEFVLRASQSFDPVGRSLVAVSLNMNQPLTVLRQPTDASADAPAALRQALSAGDLVIVPGDVGDAETWWQLDPGDGSSQSIADPGTRGVYLFAAKYVIKQLTRNEPPDADNQLLEWLVEASEPCGGGDEYTSVLKCVALHDLALLEIEAAQDNLMNAVIEWELAGSPVSVP